MCLACCTPVIKTTGRALWCDDKQAFTRSCIHENMSKCFGLSVVFVASTSAAVGSVEGAGVGAGVGSTLGQGSAAGHSGQDLSQTGQCLTYDGSLYTSD